MKQRTITAVIMTLIFIPFFFLGGWFAIIFFATLAYIGGYELISMYEKKNQLPSICKYILPLFSSILVIFNGFSGAEELVYVGLVEFALLMLLPIINNNFKIKDAIFFIFMIIYSGITFSLIANIRNIDGIYKMVLFEKINIYLLGLTLFVFVLLTTMLTDVFAYCFGIKFGKHKLCPTISPKKSIEGAIAGTIFGALSGTLFMWLVLVIFNDYQEFFKLFNISNNFLYLLAIFGIALSISLAGQLGDLIASKIKREYDIKDYGNLFPGHGGVLDRFDSSIYSFLIFAIILIIIGVM